MLEIYRFPVYDKSVIRSFRDAGSGKIFRQIFSKRFQGIEKPALRKLIQIPRAISLQDVGLLPGSRLEKLTGDREGQYSVRVNDQYRICFTWEEKDAFNVEIVDYH